MGQKTVLKISQFHLIVVLILACLELTAQTGQKDTILIPVKSGKKYDHFYDSLAYKARQKKITGIFYDLLISPPRPYVDRKAMSLEYYNKMAGKIISDIKITALEVFGPTFQDTTRKAKSIIEKAANSIHTKSNLNTIEKMLLFEVGDFLDPQTVYESERLIRSLPYIQDIRFILKQDSLYNGLVKIHVITKDRFSLGASGGVEGGSSADLEIYNQNIFGVGHEISFRFVGHLNKQPYMGLETYYKINNIKGEFLNILAGYMNTYKQEGLSFVLERPFVTPSMKWGYGITALRLFRTDRLPQNKLIELLKPLDLLFYSAWGGYGFQIKPDHYNNSQMILSAGLANRTYYQRPTTQPEENQYFSNSTFCMAGLTFTQRRYIQDKLVYSYGVTEDIPEGFKNEIVYGFDFNEFGNRHYAHIYLSNSNLLMKRNDYLYLAGGIGGYFKGMDYEQGQIQGSINYISRQLNAGSKKSRLFFRTNYLLGIRRFEIETLELSRDNHIRGFYSREPVGQQRLSFNLEYVLFLNREFYKFNMALFGFADVGIIGSNKKFIFTEKYYSGLGVGLRVHNENLVFKTFQLRLAFYPFSPNDINFTGLMIREQHKRNFYTFEPTAPQPLSFK